MSVPRLHHLRRARRRCITKCPVYPPGHVDGRAGHGHALGHPAGSTGVEGFVRCLQALDAPGSAVAQRFDPGARPARVRPLGLVVVGRRLVLAGQQPAGQRREAERQAQGAHRPQGALRNRRAARHGDIGRNHRRQFIHRMEARAEAVNAPRPPRHGDFGWVAASSALRSLERVRPPRSIGDPRVSSMPSSTPDRQSLRAAGRALSGSRNRR